MNRMLRVLRRIAAILLLPATVLLVLCRTGLIR